MTSDEIIPTSCEGDSGGRGAFAQEYPAVDTSWRIYGHKMRLRDRGKEERRHSKMFGGLTNDLLDSPGTLLPASEAEQLSTAFKNYVRIISASHDEDNVDFLNLINEEPHTKGLLDITDVFDFEEDNDEIGEINDPLFNGSLGNDQGVSFENPRDPPSVIPTNIQGSDRLKLAIMLGVIKLSRSVYWSQVLLAAKSNCDKRFGIDLRDLNKALEYQQCRL
jgi:hypothetical protein